MDNLNQNQDNQDFKSSHGGHRDKAGRPKGSSTKPKISDDLTEEEKKKLLKKVFEQAMKGDGRLIQFLLEQIYGKANQSVDLGGEAKFVLEIAKQVADKYDST